MSDITYNRVIRKLVVGFGSLFDKITLVRYNTDRSEDQRVLVPLAYATKELYVRRLEDDPNLQKKVQIALPRMSFEMNGLTYDVSRKQNTNIKQFARTTEGIVSQYNPVPYNFDFSLYIYVRNMEDGTQIIATIAGRLRQNNIRILAGDSVEIEMSPYDLHRGRIVYRTK